MINYLDFISGVHQIPGKIEAEYFTMMNGVDTQNTTDNGGGVLTGDGSPAGSGTIDYDTGAWAITLGTDLTATAEMTASYSSGNTRTGSCHFCSSSKICT